MLQTALVVQWRMSPGLQLGKVPMNGRDFTGSPAQPPYRAIKVTGSLFHTQGGCRLMKTPAFFGRMDHASPTFWQVAARLAACQAGGLGIPFGNGLLTAVALGRLAGAEAARLAKAV